MSRRQDRASEGGTGLLRRGPFPALLAGQAVSSLGDWGGALAFVAAAYELTGSPAAVGGVLVLRLLPPLLAAPLGGVLADRFDRRRLMVVTNLGMAALIGLAPFAGLALLYAIAFASEALAMLFLPARDSAVPDLVPPASLPSANGLVMGMGVAMLGGGVLFAVGIAYVRETLGGGDVEFGYLVALWGVGMAAGLGAVRVLARRGEVAAFRAAVAACGAVLIAMALLPLTWLAFTAAVVFGMAFAVAMMLAMTLVQRLDGNQVGLAVGGLLILLGSAAAGRVTSRAGPPAPGPA